MYLMHPSFPILPSQEIHLHNLPIPKISCPHEITVLTDDPDIYRVQDHGWLSVLGVRMCGFCVVFVCIVCGVVCVV